MPASIFLGEGGALYAGFMLGIMAIIAGGKIATTLLVVGIPLFDVAWVILRRLVWENRSPATADRKHLHFRLLDAGLSPRQAVLVFYAASAIFGGSAVFLRSRGKLIALLVLILLMVAVAGVTIKTSSRRRQELC